MLKQIEITGQLLHDLTEIFSRQSMKGIFNQGLWIAGGFAREVCKIQLGLSNKNILDVIDGRKQKSSDIDFFGSSTEMVKCAINAIENCPSVNSRMTYSSPFATNIQLKNIYKVQIVEKFMFDSIEDNFNSFDIANCMYAIKKEKESYIIYYDSLALECDINKELYVRHSNSPYTINRIYKYLERDLDKLSGDTTSKENFTKCLYSAVANNWDDYYQLNYYSRNQYIANNIQLLHMKLDFSPEVLSMFIGLVKINESKNVSYPALFNYGPRFDIEMNYKKCDWATYEINNKCKK
jgi:hypothetical protein